MRLWLWLRGLSTLAIQLDYGVVAVEISEGLRSQSFFWELGQLGVHLSTALHVGVISALVELVDSELFTPVYNNGTWSDLCLI